MGWHRRAGVGARRRVRVATWLVATGVIVVAFAVTMLAAGATGDHSYGGWYGTTTTSEVVVSTLPHETTAPYTTAPYTTTPHRDDGARVIDDGINDSANDRAGDDRPGDDGSRDDGSRDDRSRDGDDGRQRHNVDSALEHHHVSHYDVVDDQSPRLDDDGSSCDNHNSGTRQPRQHAHDRRLGRDIAPVRRGVDRRRQRARAAQPTDSVSPLGRAGLTGPRRWVSSRPMSHGVRVVFNGVRGSTPCCR